MRLSKKTFLYSIGITVLLVGMITVYFVTMLPSLYVDYMKKQNLQSVVKVEQGYIKNHSYQGLNVPNPIGTTTLEIPHFGNQLYLAGRGFKMTVTVKDAELKLLLEQIRGCFLDIKRMDKSDFDRIDWGILKKVVKQSTQLSGTAPIDIKVHTDKVADIFAANGAGKIHMMGQGITVFEESGSDHTNEYTTYIAVGESGGSLNFTFLPTMTPQMTAIKPIVLGSLPMIAAVLFFIVLICSQYYSKKIVNPIIRLACYAEDIKESGCLEVEPFDIKARDEIGELGRTLNELYARLRQNYLELEEKNGRLKKENERQEVFLRASSHQLKTPVTAALLLVDGMMQEVGKYKDTKAHLPEVKAQLQSMRGIVEDILYLNHCTEHLAIRQVKLERLMEEVLSAYKVQIEAKQLKVEMGSPDKVLQSPDLVLQSRGSEGKSPSGVVQSDWGLLKKMTDNLISNAVAYTQEGLSIRIEVTVDAVTILNEGAHIDEGLLPHIYEPFVSGNGRKKGKGLGLYVTAYYSEVLGHRLMVENTEDGVLSRIIFKKSCPADIA